MVKKCPSCGRYDFTESGAGNKISWLLVVGTVISFFSMIQYHLIDTLVRDISWIPLFLMAQFTVLLVMWKFYGSLVNMMEAE